MSVLEKNNNINSIYINFVNLFLLLYFVSIYIWSDNEELVVYSTVLCVFDILLMLPAIIENRAELPLSLMPIVLFDIFCAASVLWAWDQSLSIIIALRTLPLLTVFSVMLYNYIYIKSQQEFLLRAICYAGIILAIYTLFSQEGGLYGYFEGLSYGRRVGDNVNNVNIIGMAAGISLIIALYYGYIKKCKMYYFFVPILALVILGTGSNKAFVLMLLGCSMVFFSNFNSKYLLRSAFSMLCLMSVLVFSLFFVMDMDIFATMAKRFEGMIGAFTGSGYIDNSAEVRIMLIDAGLNQFIESPFLGIGINNGSLIALASVDEDFYLHNNYIELLVDCGIVGFSLFYASFIIMLKSFYKGIKEKKDDCIILFIVFVCWLIMQYGYVCYYSKITYVYLALGAVVANNVYNKKTSYNSITK